MLDFVYRLIITVGVIYLTQIILDTIGLKEPANKLVFVVVLVISIIWLLFGYTSI